MILKKCFKCGLEKEISDFYKHPQMGDGHLNKCKKCNKIDAKKSYNKKSEDSEWRESERTRGRDKDRRLYVGTQKAKPECNEKYWAKYPEKNAARQKSGRLKKPFDLAEKHHWSYNEVHYCDVIWLTKKDHLKAHRFIVYDQERKMYRCADDFSLLDTKERHENYIMGVIKNKED